MAFIIPNQTSTSLLRPVAEQTPYVRPGDWITITDTPGEIQFLFCDVVAPRLSIQTIFTQTGGVGNIYIDWGDGITDTISTLSTTTPHTYTSGGTPSVLGYNMWKIRIYGDAGTSLSFVKPLNNATYYAQSTNPIGILEMIFGDGTMTGTEPFRQYASNQSYYFCEYVKCPSVMTNVGWVFWNAFNGMRALRKIDLPVSAPNLQSCSSMFANCVLLSEPVVFPQDATGITSLNGLFNGCSNIRSITLPPTLASVADSANAFRDCLSLTSLDLPEMPNNNAMGSMFLNCYSLISFEFKAFPTITGTTCDMSSMFSACYSLEYISLPSQATTGGVYNMGSMFNGCASLKNVVLPDTMTFIGNGLLGTFTNCNSIASIILPSQASGITNLGNSFLNCYNLQEIILPSVVGATMSMNGAFNSCRSLSEITIPSGYTLTDLGGCFQQCQNLKTINLPNNAQNSLTNMASAFNACSSLQTLVLPTSMNALTSLNQTFQNCVSLQQITLPSSLPALTQMPLMCNGCLGLRSITLPTTASVLITSNGAFTNCQQLKSITMPTTTGNITTFLSLANAAVSLNTLNLPSTQSTNLTTINGLFSQTWNLTGATNVDKLGNPSTAATIYVDGGNNTQTNIPSLDFYCKFSVLNLSGQAAAPTKLASLRLRNNGSGQYGGTSPQINISYTSMGQAALVQVFNDLPTITAKTINITGCPGASLLTPAERAIATGKGWTIVG